MANLDDITESLNIKSIDRARSPDTSKNQKVIGHKRRPWLNNDLENEPIEEKGVDRPLKQKGSINPLHKPVSSTPLINPIDQPHSQKGSIKQAYRPLNISLEKLRGNPLKIAQYFFEQSRNEIEKITLRVTQTEIMRNLALSKDSARTGVRFLLKTNLVQRIAFQIGKAGWSKYKLKENLYFELENAYQKGLISPLKISTPSEEQKGSNSSNSSFININTITTNDIDPFTWDKVDITPLQEFGFNKNHLLQLKTKSTPELVQESINHFAFGLKNSQKTKKYENPISVFITVLKRGEAWIEPNYISPKEIAQQELIQRKKAERERLNKLEEEAYMLAFTEWQAGLSTAEIERITAKSPGKADLTSSLTKLRVYFKENIWSDKKKEFLLP